MATESPEGARCGASTLPWHQQQSIEAVNKLAPGLRGVGAAYVREWREDFGREPSFSLRPEMARLRASWASGTESEGISSP